MINGSTKSPLNLVELNVQTQIRGDLINILVPDAVSTIILHMPQVWRQILPDILLKPFSSGVEDLVLPLIML